MKDYLLEEAYKAFKSPDRRAIYLREVEATKEAYIEVCEYFFKQGKIWETKAKELNLIEKLMAGDLNEK